MKKHQLALLVILVLLMSCQHNKTIDLVDIQGNEYSSGVYGEAVWMMENLKEKMDRNGKPIKYYFPNDDSTLVDTYGLLYDFEVACQVCPEGWELPTNDHWEKLLASGGGYLANNYKDPQFWEGDRKMNGSMFSIRPAGSGNNGEYDNHFGKRTLFWSATKEDDHFVWTYIWERDRDSVRVASQHPTYAFSVRCVKSK